MFRYFKRFRPLGKIFLGNENGSVAVFFAISLSVMIICIGVAIDYTNLSNKQARAQNVADLAALSAANNVSDADEPPQDDSGYREGVVYSGAEVGHKFDNLYDKDAKVTFKYDFEEKEVRVEVSGALRAGFSQIMGHKTLPFRAQATAEIPIRTLNHPASIALVIDNSNSMWYDQEKSAEWDQEHFDSYYEIYREENNAETADYMARTTPTGNEVRPADTTQRIEGVKAAVNSLNTFLEASLEEDPEHEYLRMGMFPFNHNVINENVRNMSFGTIPERNVLKMEPSGETNTRKGLNRAFSKLNSEHSRFHKDIRGNLKRYVVLMTDGHNSNEENRWVQESGTQRWRGQVEHQRPGYNQNYRECEEYSYRTVNNSEAGETEERYCSKYGPRQTRWVPPQTRWRWVTVESESQPTNGRNWKEGRFQNSSLRLCDRMKDKGWEVFTIGYALNSGIYKMNLPSGSGGAEYWGVSPDDIEKATSLLQGCASKPENFILASNADQLESAFEYIGSSIANDTQLRIKN